MKKLAILVLVSVVFALSATLVFAGSIADVGSLPGTPPVGQVNWIAWLTKNEVANVPQEILTEDGTNPGSGTDQGYQIFAFPDSQPRWILQVANFTNETVGDEVNILLGGIGSSSGTLWGPYAFTWETAAPITNHDGAASSTTGPACPTQLQGSWDGESDKVVNWSGLPSSPYHIYRSQNASGAGDGTSNGRYTYIDTASTDGSGNGTYTDTTATVSSWHIVVPANPDGSIAGCHSEESNPTAVSLGATSLSAAGNLALPLIAPVAAFLLLALISLLAWRRRVVPSRR